MTVTDDELEILEENILEASFESSDEFQFQYIYLENLEKILTRFFGRTITL